MDKFSTKKRPGIVFRPGVYADKGITATEADMHTIAAASRDSVDFNLEHRPSLFDGCLGKASNFRAAPDPATGQTVLWADWDEPEPVAAVLGDAKRSVSVEFQDWKSRKITGLALAKFPRVTDAAFFSAVQGAYTAFSQGKPVHPIGFSFHTKEEQDSIPLEDFADQKNRLFPVRTEEEMRQCLDQLFMAEDPTEVKKNLVAIAERKKFRTDSQWWWPSATQGVSAPITPKPNSFPYTEDDWFSAGPPHFSVETPKQNPYYLANSPEAETKPMENAPTPPAAKPEETTLGKLRAFFGLTATQAQRVEQALIEPDPEVAKLQAEIEQLKAAQAPKFSQTECAAKASEIASQLLKDQRILPHQLESVKADFSRAIEDDFNAPRTIQFSATDEGKVATCSRVQTLQALYSALPQHKLQEEQIPEFTAENVALFSREATRVANSRTDEEFDPVMYKQMTGKDA